MQLSMKLEALKWIVMWGIFGQALSIYVPNEIDQASKPYTTGIKIKTSHYKTLSEPYYHSNYSKVYIHNKNYTSSLLDSSSDSSKSSSYDQSTKLYPVYISAGQQEKIKNVLKEHNTNVVDKETLNDRVVFKRRIDKAKNIEVYNKCPKGATGQFVYDSSCNQYLDCWSGRGGPRNCAPGTLFNPKTLECDFPEKVECLTGPLASPSAVQKSAKLQNYEQAKCPQDFSGLIPNYADCAKFIQCNSGIQSPGTCPPGTLFDINKNVCNHPQETTCFSGQSGISYVVKEQSGGSADTTGLYQSQKGHFQGQNGQYLDQTGTFQGHTGQYQGQTGQYQGQSGHYHGPTGQFQGQTGQYKGHIGKSETQGGQDGNGQYYYGRGYVDQSGQYYGQQSQGQTGHFSGQNDYLGQDQSRDGRQYYQTGRSHDQGAGCDPTSPYCNSGGYIISGQNIYRNPQVTQGGTAFVGSGTALNLGQGSSVQTDGCNPQTESCQQGVATSYDQSSFGQAHREPTQSSGGTVYIQYVICNPAAEDCSRFQQGTFILGPGGTLCNPLKQDCSANYQNIPSTHMHEQTKPNTSFSSGIYYVKYIMCNSLAEDCSPYQKGIVTATYAVRGTHNGVQLPGTSQDTGRTHPGCNPQLYNCETVRYQGQGSQIPAYDSVYSNSDPLRPPCNPQHQNCGQSSPNKSNRGFQQTHNYGQEFQQVDSENRYPQKVNSSKNYRKVCSAGDENCYQSETGTPTLTYGAQKGHSNEPKCPQGFQGITKHPTKCEKFLNCANGITYIQDCAPGTLFNPFILTCDFPYNVDCKVTDGAEVTTLPYPDSYEPQVQAVRTVPPPRQTTCQGSQCGQGQFGHSQGVYQGQGQQQGHQQPVHSGCQGANCVNKPYRQGQVDRQHQQTSISSGTQQGQGGCRGSGCAPQGSANCQGRQCRPHQGQTVQGQYPGNEQGQVEDHGGQISLYETTTPRRYSWSPSGSRRPDQDGQGQATQDGGTRISDDDSHVMKIPSKNRYQAVTPINKDDRAASGGFNNERSIDYVDIFDPDEIRNAFATTTSRSSRKPEKQVWPPPYPDLVATDTDADYVFEYEDGEPVTLAPEKVNSEKRKKSRCGNNDFVCDTRSCVEKNFVCDGVKDCDDGKDERYCSKYLEEFKLYNNARLDVLERQRWDNVSYATCALLCMDNKKFECKSFNYRKIDRVCFLTSENIGSSGGLKSYYPCDYYEKKSTSSDCSDMHKCPNGKCLTSDEVCDGYDDCGDRADEKSCIAQDFGYEVRLAGGEEEYEGRVEVTVFGKTGYICDDQFKITDANVLCKELGFNLGAAEVKGNSFYAKDLRENHTLYMMDDIECIGNETSIMHCNFAGWGIHNCADYEIAGVVCKTPEESCTEGFWKCDTGNECVKLPFLCDDLDDCTDNSDEASHHCNLPTELRLVNGTKANEGRLEIRHHGIWGSICDDDFNEDAAKIVCSHLGYSGSAYVKKDAYFGQSSGPIWLDQVSCYGNETSLEQCSHWEWGGHNCDHSEDVGIVCSSEVQAVDAQRNSKIFAAGVNSLIKNPGISRTSPEPVSCGYRKDNIFLKGDDVHFRVVQGSAAKPGDYPWQAALRIKGQEKSAHWCGAVVVASTWVLTAAHCLEGYPKGAYVVVAGEYNMDEDEGTEQQLFIEEYYIHEHFREGHKMGNDIALIKLKGKGFKLNQDIQPICLPDESSDYERELNCTISGFGTVQTGKSVYSHKLRAAWIPVQKMDVCKMAHIYGENISEGMICAGDLNGGGDACDGDSGGPLACLEDGVFTLYGLTSWGQRCGYANKPGVYVKVSHYKKWIELIMQLHS